MKCFSYIQMNRINLLGSPLYFLCVQPEIQLIISLSFAVHLASQHSCLLSSTPWLSPTFLFRKAYYLNTCLYFLILPQGLFIFWIHQIPSWQTSSPLELYFPSLLGICLYFSLNSEHHSFFFTFHHLIFPSVFTHFLFMISKVVLQSRIWCCLAAFSPDTTLQSLVS